MTGCVPAGTPRTVTFAGHVIAGAPGGGVGPIPSPHAADSSPRVTATLAAVEHLVNRRVSCSYFFFFNASAIARSASGDMMS